MRSRVALLLLPTAALAGAAARAEPSALDCEHGDIHFETVKVNGEEVVFLSRGPGCPRHEPTFPTLAAAAPPAELPKPLVEAPAAELPAAAPAPVAVVRDGHMESSPHLASAPTAPQPPSFSWLAVSGLLLFVVIMSMFAHRLYDHGVRQPRMRREKAAAEADKRRAEEEAEALRRAEEGARLAAEEEARRAAQAAAERRAQEEARRMALKEAERAAREAEERQRREKEEAERAEEERLQEEVRKAQEAVRRKKEEADRRERERQEAQGPQQQRRPAYEDNTKAYLLAAQDKRERKAEEERDGLRAAPGAGREAGQASAQRRGWCGCASKPAAAEPAAAAARAPLATQPESTRQAAATKIPAARSRRDGPTETEQAAATRLQAVWRGRAARRQAEEKRERRASRSQQPMRRPRWVAARDPGRPTH